MKKIYVHEIAAVNLSKIYFLKNAYKSCKTNNLDLIRDWNMRIHLETHCEWRLMEQTFTEQYLSHYEGITSVT